MRFYKEGKSRFLLLLGVILLFDLCLFVLFIAPIRSLARTGGHLYQTGLTVKSALKSEDLATASEGLQNMQSDLSLIRNELPRLRYVSVLPIVGDYYRDARNLVEVGSIFAQAGDNFLQDFMPFAPVVGIGDGKEDSQTSDQKVQQLVSLTPQMLPTIDRTIDDLQRALPYLSSLHWERYPNTETLPLKDVLHQIVEASTTAEQYLAESKEFLKIFPSLLGEPDPKHYLVLFQNDKELRPTGGFITSYTVLTVAGGKVSVADAKNIYEVSKSEGFLPAPPQITTYLKVTAWHLRDTNFSPDFSESMKTFEYYWQRLGQPPVDGIVALDTQFVAGLLKQLGPVEIQNYDNDFSVFPNVPEDCKAGGGTFTSDNVVCRLEFYAQRLTNDQSVRKAVIGDLMEQIFNRLMSAPSDKWYPLLQEVTSQFQQKHVLSYFKDPAAQKLAEKINWAGRIVDFDGDYIHVNDANLAGLKSDMYLKRSVDQQYEIGADGTITKTVTLTYENTGSFDGWLNATARNYVRVYVPKGSKLIKTEGGEIQTNADEDLDKTVFDNFVLVKPLDTAKVTFVYTLPFKAEEGLSLLIQKQAGVPSTHHSVHYQGRPQEMELTSDQRIKL